jgi:hypothetical protein
MGKKISDGLMGVVIAVLAVLGVLQNRELKRLRMVTPSGPLTQVETVTVTSYVDRVVHRTPPEQVSVSKAGETKADGTQRMMRGISKMLDNPAMNKMMAASQRGALDVMYADLAEQFQLEGEEKEYFMELLLARQMNAVDVSMKVMGGNLTKEEQDALSAELKEKNKLMRKEMRYFLNSADDVAEWKFYEKTLQDRMMLSQVEQTLEESGTALSDQTYRQLLEAIHEEKTSFDFSSDLNDDENMDMSAERFGPENIENYATDLKALDEKIAERVRAILTSEQFAVFMESQQANTEMLLAQLEMAGQMLGKK